MTVDNPVSKKELWKYILLKKPNRRVEILIYKENDGESHMVRVITKRLIGSWKNRVIVATDIVYGIETFLVLSQMFEYIAESPQIKKAFSREIGQANKVNWNASTNIRQEIEESK